MNSSIGRTYYTCNNKTLNTVDSDEKEKDEQRKRDKLFLRLFPLLIAYWVINNYSNINQCMCRE
jgi:hypothetical protein